MVIVAAGAAAVFSNADPAARIAADSQRLESVQIALSETATHRAALVIAFASLDSDSPAVSSEALNEALAASHRINQQLATLGDMESLQSLANEVVAAAQKMKMNRQCRHIMTAPAACA